MILTMTIQERESLAYLFVPKEIALLAIEQGFNEKTFFVYDSMNYLQEERIMREMELPFDIAPTYDQLLSWFRVNHRIDISQDLTNKSTYSFEYSLLGNEKQNVGTSDDNYHKALNTVFIDLFRGF